MSCSKCKHKKEQFNKNVQKLQMELDLSPLSAPSVVPLTERQKKLNLKAKRDAWRRKWITT